MNDKRKTLGAIKKSVLRNVEIPLSKSNKLVFKPEEDVIKPKHVDKLKQFYENVSKNVTENQQNSSKFKKPELNTALGLSKKISDLKKVKTKKIQSIGELTPKSKGFVTGKLSKNLNFQNDENVYRGLIPLNVNDSVLIPDSRKPIKTKYQMKEKKIPEPDLEDFLTPISRFEHEYVPYLPASELKRPNFDNFDNILEVFRLTDQDY